ncbi:nucleolar complex-associated protein 3 [Lentinus tigrinus ALCF2SS1-7]|uniref:Nucleolar complex-associated protein 3 n=1 Tax=Lentinus tigrinus ALCF2SS1-6 TaxID=1328759 RepID=A0A5C2SRS0_9APHY|nr:nucleolar complex-associated protein 3 [Lentinus tigrinus ALCF2SS1-6]RPD79985.1 nucleolar complex-associated protein 3 [Lentinus tigrinus ALCF2SS1-7]
MPIRGPKKRSAQAAQRPSKKRKLADDGKASKSKTKGKEKASDRATIPIPNQRDEDDVELSEDDLGMLDEYGGAVSFLRTLDQKGIARSKKETERLYQLHKPVRKAVEDDLPSLDSHSEGEDEDEDEQWSSGIENMSEDEDMSGPDDEAHSSAAESSSMGVQRKRRRKPAVLSEDEEQPFEYQPRRRHSSWEPESNKDKGIERLPIKLADGRIQKSGSKVVLDQSEDSGLDSDNDSADEQMEDAPHSRVEDVTTGARFGRPAVVDVIGQKSRKARVQGAKEQIAGLCQEILGDPENSLGLLRRLHTFSLPQISTPTHPDPVPNDVVIRKLTMLSQLAVFKDIIPGYRIRALTDKEKAEKVSQMVQRTRDWEQGLVGVYQTYLRSLEAELKAKSELAETALHCMCALLVEATHFNFRVNLMSSIVAALSRKSWDKSSDMCLDTLVKVFRADNTGEPSLEIVRLLNRMIKERRYNVHPEVLSCLLHLRLKSELGVRASETKVDKESGSGVGKALSKSRAAARRAKGKAVDQPHLSKKAKKALKERKEIEKEMHEAAAEVDKEERATRHTETLKLLFVLYFSILKTPHPTPLLSAALRGIAKFAHLVNIDFFKDLLQVLKTLMTRDEEGGVIVDTNKDTSRTSPASGPHDVSNIATVQHQLLCIVTAFELLSGQGEALDIDLSDFINRLYTILPQLALMPDIETAPPTHARTSVRGPPPQSPADTLFRALHLAFTPRSSAAAPPPWRSAAFAKRLLSAALQWPPATAARAIELVSVLVERDPKLEALLSTEDRAGNGVYRPDVDDPQVCNAFGTSFWELRLLAAEHYAEQVRVVAGQLLNSHASS